MDNIAFVTVVTVLVLSMIVIVTLLLSPNVAKLVRSKDRLRDCKKNFRRLASERSGTFLDRGWGSPPHLILNHTRQLFNVTVHESIQNSNQWVLHVTTNWSNVDFRMRLTPERQTEQTFPGLDDLQIGDKAFDDAFVVQSDDEDQLKEILNPAACQALLNLLNSGRALDFEVHVVGGSFVFRCHTDPNTIALLRSQLDQIFSIYFIFSDQHHWTEQGIQWMSDVDDVQPPEDAVIAILDERTDQKLTCLVCGSQIKQKYRVDCRSCGTPHHKECWIYFGKCSTYACGQRKFRKGKKRFYIS